MSGGDVESESKVEIKCRGFQLAGKNVRKEINRETYEKFVTSLVKEDEKASKLVPQFQISLNKKTRTLFSKMQLKAFCNANFDKRIILKKDNYCVYTLPIGYDEELLKQVQEISKPLKL